MVTLASAVGPSCSRGSGNERLNATANCCGPSNSLSLWTGTPIHIMLVWVGISTGIGSELKSSVSARHKIGIGKQLHQIASCVNITQSIKKLIMQMKYIMKIT